METLLNTFGDRTVVGAAGFLIGILFGVASQNSQFCMRSATVEVFERRAGDRTAVWLIAFFAAIAFTQAAVLTGYLDTSTARQISARGSMSGAIVGGLMFGAGMILTRGCAGRLLVLSGTGNMRALVAGLVVTLVAQASFRGALDPAREAISALWTIPGGSSRDVGVILGIGASGAFAVALAGLALAGLLAWRSRVKPSHALGSLVVGLTIALGWMATYAISQASFAVVPVASITFTGPATDTLMALVAAPTVSLSFGIGLVPGVFVGSAAMAIATGQFKIQRFGADTPMERYLAGGAMMGFGAMLAGGCAIGATVSGGAVLSLTALIAGASMWLGSFGMQAWMGRAQRQRVAAA